METIKWAVNEMPKTDDSQLQVMSLENVAKARAFHESFPQSAVSCFVFNRRHRTEDTADTLVSLVV